MNPSQAVVNHPNHEAGAERRVADKVALAVKVHGFGNTVFDMQRTKHSFFLDLYLARCMDMSTYFYFIFFLAVY